MLILADETIAVRSLSPWYFFVYVSVCGCHVANLFDIHFFNSFKSQRKWNFQRILCLFSTKSQNRQPKVKCFSLRKFPCIFFRHTRETCYNTRNSSQAIDGFTFKYGHPLTSKIILPSKLFHIKSFLRS